MLPPVATKVLSSHSGRLWLLKPRPSDCWRLVFGFVTVEDARGLQTCQTIFQETPLEIVCENHLCENTANLSSKNETSLTTAHVRVQPQTRASQLPFNLQAAALRRFIRTERRRMNRSGYKYSSFFFLFFSCSCLVLKAWFQSIQCISFDPMQIYT